MSKKRKFISPPIFAEWILGILLSDKIAKTPLGDFEEYYNMIHKEKGSIAAYRWYWGQVINLLPQRILNSSLWGFIMFNNYIKIAFRNLIKNKGYSFINISGLAIAMVCTLLILQFVKNELSYDDFHDDSENIYRIIWRQDYLSQTRTPYPLAMALVQDFPEVVDAVTISPIWGPGLTRPYISVKYGDIVHDEYEFFGADTNFFKMFSFKLLRGNPETALQTINGIVISEKVSKKYFGNENPIGKQLILDGQCSGDVTVTGVIENIPTNSHFDFLISYKTLIANEGEDSQYYSWGDFGHFNYVKLQNGADSKLLERKIPEWSSKYINWSDDDLLEMKENIKGLRLQPLEDIHLHSNIRWELEANGDITYVYIFSGAAFLILLIACINFMNLTMGRAINRYKEIGIRKVIGAGASKVFYQFLGETIFATGISMIFAIILLYLILPIFNQLVGQSISYEQLFSSEFLIEIFLIVIVAPIIAGTYPAAILSRLNPVLILKGSKITGSTLHNIGKVLLIFQFAISVGLIISVKIVSEQMTYLSNKNLGFEKEQILVVPIKQNEMKEKYLEIKNELTKYESILNATAVSNIPGSNFNQNDIGWNKQEDRISVSELRADEDLVETLKVEMVKGRSFSLEHSTDKSESFIINESLAKSFNWKSPIGEEIIYYDDGRQISGTIIGVVKDFHYKSLHSIVEPLIILFQPQEFNYMMIKIKSVNMEQTIASIKKEWEKFDTRFSFEYSFLDESFDKQYVAEQNMKSVFSYFTGVAIFIACMGLFGMSVLNVQKKYKEIGIRKVLGASTSSVVINLLKEYINLIVVSTIIIGPIVYYIMNSWLQKFAYRIEINILSFLVSGLIVLSITLLTVFYQVIKAAVANPVESIRNE